MVANEITQAQLPPFDIPLGPQQPDAHFYRPEMVTLQMKEKILSVSGDEFEVVTTAGAPVCRVRGQVFSLHRKKVFTDVAGRELWTLNRTIPSLNMSFHGVSPAGQDVFEVKGHFSLGASSSSCTFRDAATGKRIGLDIDGDWLDRRATVSLCGRNVALISRDFINGRQVFAQRSTYYVTVAANVDLALIAALCVCLDERRPGGNPLLDAENGLVAGGYPSSHHPHHAAQQNMMQQNMLQQNLMQQNIQQTQMNQMNQMNGF